MSETYTFQDYVSQCHRLIDQVKAEDVGRICDVLEAAFVGGHTVFACGNGGSAASSSHFIEDLAKLMLDERSGRRLKAQALTDATPFITALANDDGYERIFEIQLAVQSSPGDVLLCISGSGNSPNVLRAARWANAHGMRTVGLTGYNGGELANLVRVHLHVASRNMGMLESVHAMLLDFISKEVRFRAYGIGHPER